MARHYRCPKCDHIGYGQGFKVECSSCGCVDLLFEQETYEAYTDRTAIINHLAKYFGHVESLKGVTDISNSGDSVNRDTDARPVARLKRKD